MGTLDIVVLAAYLVGTTLFGCSFFFRKKKGGDGARAIPTSNCRPDSRCGRTN